MEASARREAGRVWDSRAVHFVDTQGRLTREYSAVLQFPPNYPAWDIYFVFGPAVRWEDRPPRPTYWMHQLGGIGPPDLRLDGDRMARVVKGLLDALQPSTGPAQAAEP